MNSAKNIDRTWHYYLDAEGTLWHEGAELEDPGLLKFFMEKMTRLPDGSFQVICQGELCLITAEDVPYVIQSIQIEPQTIHLIFPGGYEEELNPTTLVVGKENVLYCQVRNGDFKARFNRKSYLELAKLVEFDAEKNQYYLVLAGNQYIVCGV